MPPLLKRHLPALLLAALAIVLQAARGGAQAPPEPYAAINREAVNYAGPGRDIAHDLTGAEIRIGLLAPLAGARQPEGSALIAAGRLAIEDENSDSLVGGRTLALVVRDESGPWGRASSEIVRLVFDDRVVALVTSLEGGMAHLAEQVGNKIGVPVLTLSTDKTTTQINLPWIFRLAPSDAAQARAFARDIYRARGLKKAVLVIERDHDGRVGGEEFEKAARDLTAPDLTAPNLPPGDSTVPAPLRLTVDPSLTNLDATRSEIISQKPEAVVFWTGPETAQKLVAQVRDELPSVPIYLSRKAAQGQLELWRGHCRSCSQPDGGLWVVSSPREETAARENFARRYLERTGTVPSLAVAQAYDAVRIIAAALRRSGPNRARLRDSLAETSKFSGASGLISFDHAGNNLTDVTLVQLRSAEGSNP